MLDVHPPEHRISEKRDFFVHLFTITCGLLIALMLENAAEWVHHFAERKEAERSIREELGRNREDLVKYAPTLKQEGNDMLTVLGFVQSRSTGNMVLPPKLNIVFHEAPIPDAAWRTAASTGALSYMPYDAVERFAAAYKEQEMLQTAEEKTLEDYLALGSVMRVGQDPSTLTKEQALAALPLARSAIAHLSGMNAIGQGTKSAYDEALQ